MRPLFALLCLCACTQARHDVDCQKLLADPGTTLNKLMHREPDPAKAYAILERCLVPDGDTCDRAAADRAMMPSMAISDDHDGSGAAARAAAWKEYAVQCRALPTEQQRCLLVSWAIDHDDCAQVQEKFRREHPPTRQP